LAVDRKNDSSRIASVLAGVGTRPEARVASVGPHHVVDRLAMAQLDGQARLETDQIAEPERHPGECFRGGTRS
jgi:hypothetical protein